MRKKYHIVHTRLTDSEYQRLTTARGDKTTAAYLKQLILADGQIETKEVNSLINSIASIAATVQDITVDLESLPNKIKLPSSSSQLDAEAVKTLITNAVNELKNNYIKLAIDYSSGACARIDSANKMLEALCKKYNIRVSG
ncbi:MAG: hypothetical protein HQL08_08700 [Nitrospirae bacterium]|nr:hypothetical protein [Nitrospirota bacterium]